MFESYKCAIIAPTRDTRNHCTSYSNKSLSSLKYITLISSWKSRLEYLSQLLIRVFSPWFEYNTATYRYEINPPESLCFVPSNYSNSNKKQEHNFFQIKARHAFFFFLNKAMAGAPTLFFLLLWRIPSNQFYSTLLNFMLIVKLFFG